MAAKKSAKKQAKQTMQAEDLLIVELREIYSAETQLSRVLPRIAKAVSADSVRQMFQQRMEEGQQLIADLDAAFEQMEVSPGRKKNVAAEGLIADAQEHVQEIEKGPALDAVLIGAMQKTEHYCIAAWGTAKAIASALGEAEIAEAMERALDEGKAFDEELTRIAESEILPPLIEAGSEDAEEMEEDEEPSGAQRGGGRGKRGDGARDAPN